MIPCILTQIVALSWEVHTLFVINLFFLFFKLASDILDQMSTSAVKSHLVLGHGCFYSRRQFSSLKVNAWTSVTSSHQFARILTMMRGRMRGCWCIAESVEQQHAGQFFFMVLEAVMLSWSPERTVQSGRSIGLSLTVRGGWRVCVCVYMCMCVTGWMDASVSSWCRQMEEGESEERWDAYMGEWWIW